MRTNIVIDDKLMMDALKASGLSTKKEVVEQGLKLLVRRSQQQEIRDFIPFVDQLGLISVLPET